MALSLSNHRTHLNLFLQTMVAEGLVSNEFVQLQSLKATCGRDVVIRTITSYWGAVKQLFTQMTNQLDIDFVDYSVILACAQNLLERSNSIGAVHVSIACTDIVNGCDKKDIDCCKQGLIMAKREFARLQVKYESVVELERNIIECEDMQKGLIFSLGNLEVQLEKNNVECENMQNRATQD